MRAYVHVALAGAFATTLAGCGLSTVGLAPIDGAGDDGGGTPEASPTGDGSVTGDGGQGDGAVADAKSDVQPSGDGAAGACVKAIPAGWGLVAYEPARAACPAGYGGGHDEYSGATASAGACACTCQITAAPDCTAGTIATFYGGGAGTTCPSQGESITVNGSTCTALAQAGNLAQYFSAQPVALSGGSCSGIAQGNPSQVSKQGVRYCDVPPPSAEAVCEGATPSTFAACIVSGGDVACPTGSPFTHKTLVADDEILTCSACAGCSVSGTCSSPQISLYADSACTQQVTRLASDGTCVSSGANNKTVVAAEYSAQTNASCQASGSTASVSPQGPHTLCCR
jgi:hypothetical protein